MPRSVDPAVTEAFARLPGEELDLLRPAALPTWVPPMLATLSSRREFESGWVFERKLDGFRVLARKEGRSVTLQSRNRLSMNERFPGVVEALERMDAPDMLLDGEIVAFRGHDSGFRVLQQRGTSGRGRTRIVLYAFDLLHLGGFDTTRLPQLSRKRVLQRAFAGGEALKLVPHRNAPDLDEACRRGWEGLIAKEARASYRSGRSPSWLKLKCSLEQELVIAGYTDPRGSRPYFGALVLGYYEDGDLLSAGEVGTGFSQAMLRSLHARLKPLERDTSPFADVQRAAKGVHFVEPRLVAQVGFSEWTGTHKLRHPRFVGLREDKDPKDVVRERPN